MSLPKFVTKASLVTMPTAGFLPYGPGSHSSAEFPMGYEGKQRILSPLTR